MKNLLINVYLIIGKILPYIHIKNTLAIKNEIIKRRKSSILNYRLLSSDLSPIACIPLYIENNYYGNNKSYKKCSTQKLNYKYLIEHGYYFGNYVPDYSFNLKNMTIITYGEERVKHLKEAFLYKNSNGKKLKIITIGPYIKYADSILSHNEKKKIKKIYRKILLVFPSHSIKGVIYKYNIKDFINRIEDVSKNYDNVFVCMYWKDIQDGRHIEYEKKGYKIVTAGHINDPNFLGRLKDIIELSDMTMSNTVGTHIGYCVSEGKPHYLFNQFQKIEGEGVDAEFKDRKSEEYLKIRDEETNEIIEAFSNFSYIITDKQKHVVEKYWGKNEVNYYRITKKGKS